MYTKADTKTSSDLRNCTEVNLVLPPLLPHAVLLVGPPPRNYTVTWDGLYEFLDDCQLGEVARELSTICYLISKFCVYPLLASVRDLYIILGEREREILYYYSQTTLPCP